MFQPCIQHVYTCIHHVYHASEWYILAVLAWQLYRIKYYAFLAACTEASYIQNTYGVVGGWYGGDYREGLDLIETLKPLIF